MPLLLRHIEMKPEQISIVTAEERGRAEAEEYGIKFHRIALTRENFRTVLDPHGRRGRFHAELVGGCVEPGSDQVLPHPWRALPGHLHRALGRRLYRHQPVAIAALELCAARSGAPAQGRLRQRTDRRDNPWRQSGSGVAFRQAGPAGYRPRYRDRGEPRAPGTAGPSWRRRWGSRPSMWPSATPRSPTCPRSAASSSIRGRSTGSSAKAASRPSLAGGPTRRGCRPTAAAMTSAAIRRST